ncbi:hypothetical protein CWO03_20220 [Vibrio splendidus]|nr:hypothetical protein CWO03_20220 [Vibrio splendidus]
MHYLFIDTCIWLNLAKSKNQYALIEALEQLVESDEVTIVVPDLVKVEFERNRDRVLESTRQQVGTEFRKVKQIVKAYGGDCKNEALAELNDISSRLPILSEVTGHMSTRIQALMDKSFQLEITQDVKLKAVERGLNKLAPFHRQKNSVADAVLIEAFYKFKVSQEGESFHFITDNHTDFSSQKDKRDPHPDFEEIFNGETSYHLDLVGAIQLIAPDLLEQLKAELDWIEDDTRGLNDILSAIEEFTEKVWYNRHMNNMYHIEQGEIEIIPEGEQRYGSNVIHEDVWKRAKESAARVKSNYEDTGPWTDFEWGMLNGKLSALRWVLGEEWDMLDT